MSDVKTIVGDWLKANGYEGLFNENAECGCDLDDLMVCGSPGIETCVPAYKLNCIGCIHNCLDVYKYMMGTDVACDQYETLNEYLEEEDDDEYY